MKDAADAIRAFSEAMQRSVDDAVRRLAPPDDPAIAISWTEGNLMHLEVKLASGRFIRGVGEAKLEAIADAERRALAGA